MPRFNNTKLNASIDIEVCDFFDPKDRIDKLCKYFTGNREKKKEIENCRHHCSIHESKQLMEEGQVFRRVKGALRKK